jgi:hypothetical protein
MDGIALSNISSINLSLQNNRSLKKNTEINHYSSLKNKLANESNKTQQFGSIKTTKSSNDSLVKIPFYPSSTQMKSKNFSISTDDNDKEKTTLYSTWTPLNDEKYNQKVKFSTFSFRLN